MIQSSREFAEKLYSLLKDNDVSGHYADTPPDDCIAQLENYLTDLHMVAETIRDIEEVSDMFDDHELYVAEVKPLLYGLREIRGKLEAAERRRMVSETNYEVKHAIRVGDKEIVFAADEAAKDGMYWFVGDYNRNEIIGQYADCQVSGDFLEAMQEFTGRVNIQIEAVRSDIVQSKTETHVFTSEHCFPHDYGQSIDGKIVAIKAEILRPEYRRGEIQLVLVDGGNGARANPNGRAVYCYQLNNGERTRFERHDVQGEVRPEYLPDWAEEKAAAIRSEKSAAQPNKNKKDKGDTR